MIRVAVRDLTKVFAPNVKPVDNVSFEVGEREFLTLLGPSGCGKSTVLRMIAGLEAPTSGEIRIGERVVNRLAPAERNVAMVFQSYALYPHLTVFENIAVNLQLRRVPRDEVRQRVAEAARMLDIESLLERRPKQLSGGQRQRVALGRAIVRKPEVFLLDEPLSNLDAILRERMRAELKALFGQLGATVIYVTHDQTEAMTMSKKVAVLNEGKIQQLGAPEEIYDRPANAFVATFVGSPRINLLRARVVEDGAVVGNQKIRLPRGAPRDRDEVLLGIRPENVRIGSGEYEARVRSVEPLGAITMVEVDFDGQPVRALAKPGARYDGAVNIGFDEERMHFFDPKSGQRL